VAAFRGTMMNDDLEDLLHLSIVYSFIYELQKDKEIYAQRFCVSKANINRREN
jgi:hypothetical protein